MNSDKDNNSESVDNRLLAWLLGDNNPPANSPPSEAVEADLEMDELDPLDSEELNIVPSNNGTGDPVGHLYEVDGQRSTGGVNPTRPTSQSAGVRHIPTGEIPTVQNRFQALLKRRLKAEIELHPPLFPWETEISDYEPVYSDNIVTSGVPCFHFWTAQLRSLSLPVTLPETVLAQLLDTCQEVVQSPLQQGAKMVRAVSSLFPEQPQSLNEMAGLVLRYPTRSPREQQLFTSTYEAATADQQMALSLLAAREILNTLTLSVSPNQPLAERKWQTAAGMLTLQAEYQLQGKTPKLRVESRLPRGGSLKLQTQQGSASAQRLYPGYLSVESYDLIPNQTYPVEVRFQELDQQPLVFVISPTA